MSDIPFVNYLGDAIDEAAAAERSRSRRRRPRRALAVVAAMLLTAGSGVAVAELLSDPVEQAASGVSCYESSTLRGGAAGVWAADRSPQAACADALNRDPQALVACDNGGEVVVFPGAGAAACTRAGLRPLTPQYATERERVADLQRALIALEDSADCIEPGEFARRAQELLDRSGWTGWRTWVRDDITTGSCGSVSSYGGNGVRTIAGALDPEGLRLMVFAGASRSVEKELLFGEDAAGPALMDASAERCHTVAELRELVARRLGGTGRDVRYTVSEPEDGVEVMGAGGDRLDEGCAIITSVSPAADGFGVDVQIWSAE